MAALSPLSCSSKDGKLDACTEGSNELYERRIQPVLADARPSSCNQCHLSGVDLSLFARSSPCETMACLIDAELVDLKAPDESKVLSWIERATPDSELITEEVIQAEHAAFSEWIEYVAGCGACAEARCGSAKSSDSCEVTVEPDGPYDAAKDPGGCDDKALERVFLETIYTTRGRCYPCHFTNADKPPPGATLWLVEGDNCAAASLASMRNVVKHGYVDEESPEQSLLLLKPLAESNGGVAHGGHDKFTKNGDPAYDNFIYWLTRYAECANTEAP